MNTRELEQLDHEEYEVCRNAVDAFGCTNQLVIATEEMSELTKELCKAYRNKANVLRIAEEIADVEIMLTQIKLMFKCGENVLYWKKDKLDRLAERLKTLETVV